MKKFIIFFLMVFLCIGNYQVRSESRIATDIGKVQFGWETLKFCEPALLPPYVLDVNREEKITANYITLERNCETGEVTLIADRSYFTTPPNWTGPNAFTALGLWEIVVNESGLYTATDGVNQDEINAEVYDAHSVVIEATTNGATNPFNLGIQGITTISFAAVIPNNPTPDPADYTYQWYINGNAVATVDTIVGNGVNFAFPRNMAAGTYMVTVGVTHNASGCVAVSNAFQINVGASIAVNIFGPQTACNGEIVTFTAQVDGDEIGHRYQWIRDGQYLPGETGQTYSFNTDSLEDNYYSYAVVVTRDGCETTYSPEIPFHIYNLGVELTADPAAICFGNSTMLTANLLDNNGDNIIYRWYEGSVDPANIIRGRTGSQAMVTPGVYGDTQYFVVVSKADASCISIDSITISATNSLPAVTILMSSDTICEGQPVTLVANAGENAIYTWYRNGYTLPTTTGRILNDIPSANGTGSSVIYTVDITDPELGCSYETSASAPVWVNPSIDISISGDPIVCSANSTEITLIATVDGDAGSTPVYNWTVNGIAQTTTSDTLTFDAVPATDPYAVTVNLNSASGCNVTSDPFYIYVGDAPVLQVSVSHTEVCLGGEVMVQALVGNGTADGLDYTWTENGVDATYRGLSFSTTINTNTIFGLTIDAGNDCVASGTSPEVSVVTLDGLALNVEANIENGCDGAQVIVSATVLDNNGNNVTPGYTYTWFKNGILMEGVTGPRVMESLMSVDGDTTRYIYTASIAVPGCDGNNFSASDTVIIRRNPMVVIDGFHDVCGDAASPNIRLYAWVDGRNNYEATFVWYESGQLKGTYTGNNFYSEDLSPRTDPYVYTVEVINTNGCSSFADPFEVYIHFPVDVHVTASEDTVCANAKVLLTANLRDNNAANITYQWYKGAYNNSNIIYGATNKTYLANINEAARYYVEVIQLNSSCIDTASYYIHMNEIPQLTDITVIGNNVICSGGQITLQANMAGTPTGNEVYTWYRNGVLMEGANGATILDSPIAIDDDETIYYYSASVAQSASACVSQRVTSPMVTVFGNPRVMISGNRDVCETESVFLIANVDTASRGAGILHYTWYESGQIRDNMAEGFGDSQFFSEYFYEREAPYVFQVEAYRDAAFGGCRTLSEPFLVYVHKEPVVNVTATETEVCENGTVTLTANLDNYNNSNIIYQWYILDTIGTPVIGNNGETIYEYDTIENNIPGATERVYTTNVAETNTYGVRVSQTNSECTANSDILITVSAGPVVNNITVANDLQSVCEGRQITLTANVTGGVTGGETFVWYRNNQLIEGADQATYTETPLTIGDAVTTYTYNVAVNQMAMGCSSGMNPNTAVTITVNPAPTVVISGNPMVCTATSNNVALTANVHPEAVAGNYTYEWFEDNVSLGVSSNNTFTATRAYRNYPYSFSVKVNNDYGCSVTSDLFSVYVNEQPQIYISANETEICEGGEVTLRADLSDWNTGQLVYQWYRNGQAIPGATSLTYTTTLEQSAQFSFEVNQTSSTCEGTSNVLQITVMPRPIAVISSIDNQVVCSGGQVILTASVTNYNNTMGEATYTWFRNGIQIENANQSILIDSPAAIEGLQTSYIYAVQVTMRAAGCTSAISQGRVVTVNATPTVYVSADRSLTYCESGDVTLTANVHPVSNNYQYQWFRDNVAINGATSQTYTSNDSIRETPYNYHVVVTSVPGCQVISTPVMVTVIGQPVVVITTDNPTICEGGTATLTATIEGGVGDYTYTWYNNTSSTAIGNGPVYTVPSTDTTGTYTYYVEVVNNYGCEVTAYYADFNIVPGPTVTISVANGYNSTVCNGGATLLIADVTGGVGENSYQWYKNGIILPGETNVTLNTGALYYDITASFTVRVSQSGVECVAQSEQFNVDVIPMPTVTITGNTNTCEGGTVTLTAEVDMNGMTGNFTYQWFRVTNGYATPIAGATGAEYITSALTMENHYEYYVEVSSPVSGCSVTSGTVQASVVADPMVTIMGAHSVCEGGNLTLTAYMTGGVEGEDYTYTWRWWHNGSEQTEVTNVPTFVPTLTANDPATPYYFTVTVDRTDNSGCNATSAAFEVNVISSPQAIVTMDRSTVCLGGSITFTANVTPVGSYNYVWNVNGQTRGYQSQLTLNDLPVGINQIYVEAIPVNSNSACNATSQTVTATVVADPVINNITVNETLLCVGGTVRLSVNASDIILDPAANTGDYTYQWAVNGFEIPGAIQPQFVQAINQPGQYQYSLRVIMDNGQFGCASDWSNSVNVTVAPQPQIQVHPVSQGIVDICVGGTIDLQASLLPVSQPYTSIYGNPVYDWVLSYNPNDEGGVSTGVTTDRFTRVLDQPGTYYYKAIATYPNGLSCNVATSNSIKVTVYPAPVWNEISVNVSNGALCMGEEVELHASLLSDIHHTYGAIQWYYSIDGAAEIAVNDMGPDVIHMPTEAGYYDYIVRYTGVLGSGCTLEDGIPAPKINGHTIVVHELPSAEFTAGDGSVICSRSIDKIVPLEVTFTGTPPFAFAIENMTTGQVYAFQSIYQTVYTFNVEATSTSVFRITELRDRYCSASDQLDVTSYVTIYISNVEVPETFTAGCDDDRDQYGNPIVYLPIRITSGNPTTYSVEFRDNAYDNFNIYNGTIEGNATWGHTIRIVMPNTPGDYELTITIDGCEYSTTGKVLIDGGFFGEGPLVEVRWDDVLVVNNNPETNGGYRFHSYQWYKNGAPVQGDGSGQYYHENGGLSGTYYVVVDGIRLSDGSSVQFMTCPQRHNTNSNIRVYPVPAQVNQMVTIEIDLTLEELEGAVLDIYDARGALVQTVNTVQPITKVNGFQAQGAYFGRITTGTNEIKTVKFVIVR